MNKQSANALVADTLHMARLSHQNGGLCGYRHGYHLGTINVAVHYLGADHWIAEGARNEINYMAYQDLRKGIL